MEQRLEWFGTLRARLGATPTPDSLIYATGGLAVGRIKTSGSVIDARAEKAPAKRSAAHHGRPVPHRSAR
jgi:opacity protein-like surface antigen